MKTSHCQEDTSVISYPYERGHNIYIHFDILIIFVFIPTRNSHEQRKLPYNIISNMNFRSNFNIKFSSNSASSSCSLVVLSIQVQVEPGTLCVLFVELLLIGLVWLLLARLNLETFCSSWSPSCSWRSSWMSLAAHAWDTSCSCWSPSCRSSPISSWKWFEKSIILVQMI